MKNLQNLYEVRKTIRFRLVPQNLKRPYQSGDNQTNIVQQVGNFAKQYTGIIQSFENLAYFQKQDQDSKLSKKVYVKHSWLRNYTKTEFYKAKDKLIKFNKKGQKQGNKVSISDQNVQFLDEYFSNWIVENKECIENLNDFTNRPEKNLKRISDLAYWIRKITKRSNFEFLFELFNENIDHKSSNEEINKIRQSLEKCKMMLKNLEKAVLPSQSLGVEIERASFNYYTVNKKQKDYPKKIQGKERELQKKLSSFKKVNKRTNRQENLFNLNQKLNFLKNVINNLDEDYFVEENFNGNPKLIKDFNHIKLKKAYKFLKKYKYSERSKFYELLSLGKTNEEMKQSCPLFDCSDDNFNKIKRLTEDIASTKDDHHRKRLIEKRAIHFDVIINNGNSCSFEKYKEICSLFQKVAKQFGKIKAEIKALEKEKVDAEKLQSWAVILEKDNQKYILTIPRDAQDNLKKAKEHIDNLENDDSEAWKLYSFESLALQALDKLCFGLDKNTFYPEIKDELQQKNNSFFINGNLKRKDQFSDDGLELIRFYQAVLSLDATKDMLAINNFEGLGEIIKNKYENKENFEKDLKHACYYKKPIQISEETKNKIVEDYQGNLYKITSYDLEKADKEEIAKLKNKTKFERNNPEQHTKIWLDFWSDENTKEKHPIRLNPEFKINFVEKKSDNLENRNLGELKKNRRLKDQFLLSTTITLQAHEKNKVIRFQDQNEIKNQIEEYNKKFNDKINPFETYYYGLDRGQQELLTLGIFKFSEDEKVQFTDESGNTGEYHKPEFVDLEVYQIRENQFLAKNEKGRIVYKSPDQFIDNDNVIEKINIQSCLDLSCAKLIKNKIVLNGDITTYLELKRVSALRKIFDGVMKKRFTSDMVCFNADRSCFFLNIENRGKTENEDLYFYDDKFSEILPLDTIKKELQSYLDNDKNNNAIEKFSIEKVNHLRDAICANTVGIINFLQKTYFGMIVFEDLDINNKNKRISEFSGNLGSRVELKLLQKFQSLSLVPLYLKQFFDLQTKKELDQAGIVQYVQTAGTSSNCPHCGTKNSDKSDKWNSHAYKCKNKNCNFDTAKENQKQGLTALDNSDKVAAYNIAKRGLGKLQLKEETTN